MFDINTMRYTNSEVTLEQIEDMKSEYVRHHLARDKWFRWCDLPWWKRLFVKEPPYEPARGYFLTDND